MEYAVATDADLPAMDDGVYTFWSAMASLKTGAGHYKYSTISILMKTYLLLPNSNEDSERVFSMVNKICTEHRADLAQDTVAAVLSVNLRVDPQRFEPSRNELGKAKSATIEYNPAFAPCMMSRVRLLNHLWTNLSITVYINLANFNMFVS